MNVSVHNGRMMVCSTKVTGHLPERQQKMRAEYALQTSSSAGCNSHVTPAESFMGVSVLVISKLSCMQLQSWTMFLSTFNFYDLSKSLSILMNSLRLFPTNTTADIINCREFLGLSLDGPEGIMRGFQ